MGSPLSIDISEGDTDRTTRLAFSSCIRSRPQGLSLRLVRRAPHIHRALLFVRAASTIGCGEPLPEKVEKESTYKARLLLATP